MAIVFLSAMLQPLTGGVSQVRVAGRTIRTIINNLEERFPGIKDRLLQDGDLRPDVAIAVDGEMGRDGLAEQVGEDSEVHFIPPLSGGGVGCKREPGETGSLCQDNSRLLEAGPEAGFGMQRKVSAPTLRARRVGSGPGRRTGTQVR